MIHAHTNRAYENELKNIKLCVKKMAFNVKNMLSLSIKALQNGGLDLARETILSDKKINQQELDIDNLCLIVLAKRQPMGSDLRFITIVMKMVTDLERMGDFSANIAKKSIELKKFEKVQIPDNVFFMAKELDKMIEQTTEAFLEFDANLAEQIILQDDLIDDLYHQTSQELMNSMKVPGSPVEPLIHIQSVAKWLERIGDHCTNLAEFIFFLVRGKNLRHSS